MFNDNVCMDMVTLTGTNGPLHVCITMTCLLVNEVTSNGTLEVEYSVTIFFQNPHGRFGKIACDTP